MAKQYISEEVVRSIITEVLKHLRSEAGKANTEYNTDLGNLAVQGIKNMFNNKQYTIGTPPAPKKSPDLYKLSPWSQLAGDAMNVTGNIVNTMGENYQNKRQAVSDSINNVASNLSNSIKGPNNPFIFMNAIAKGVETKGKNTGNWYRTAGDALKTVSNYISGIDNTNVLAKMLANNEPGMSNYAWSTIARAMHKK